MKLTEDEKEFWANEGVILTRHFLCSQFCSDFSNKQLFEMKSLKDVLASVDLRPDEIAKINKWRAEDQDLEEDNG